MIEPRLSRTTGALVIGALVIGGLVAVSPPVVSPAAAEVGVPETFLVSRTPSGTSEQPFLAPDGQKVAFVSTAGNLVTGDDNGVADIFVSTAVEDEPDPFDVQAVLVSRPDSSMPQVPADGPSSHPVMSADGRHIAYLSAATNLVEGDHAPQQWVNVYVRDQVLGTTIRIPAPDGGEPLGDSRSVDMSDDGRYVAFVSEAANLSPGDGNETWDGFIADLDADGNGVRGDISVTRVLPDLSVDYGVTELVISGNGETIAFGTDVPLNADDPVATDGYVYRGARKTAGAPAKLVAAHATHVSIDATGEAVAYVSATACSGGPIIVASTFDAGGTYSLAVGWFLIDRRVGTIADPQISADGGHVAWVTTQPRFQFEVVPALPAPIIRTEPIPWRDGNFGVQCSGGFSGGAIDLGVGDSPSPSASGRTVAFTGPHPADPAVSSVMAVDSHIHEGLAVTSSQGSLLTPGFMAVVDITKIPVSSLRDYAATLADAPIHQVPIHQVPIHQVPIHQVPIHQVPIHQVPIHQVTIPGGWTELLADTPFADELEQSVLLDNVLAWAEEYAAAGSPATPAQRAAAERILLLTLGDIDMTGSGIDSLAMASLVLGRAPVSQILIPGDGSATERWEAVVAAQEVDATIEPGTLLADLDMAGLDVGSSGIESAVLRDLPIEKTVFDTIPVGSLELKDTPLGDLDAATLDDATQLLVYGGPVSGPLSALTPLDKTTLADLAAGAPATFTLGDVLFSLLNANNYPWEQIAPASIDPNAAVRLSPGRGCDGHIRCEYTAKYTFAFDPGPGESTQFVAPTASVTLPTGTVRAKDLFATGSGPLDTWRGEQYGGAIQGDGNLVRVPLSDMPGGTVLELEVWHSGSTRPGATTSTGTLTSGAITASALMRGDAALDTFDDPANNWIDGDWEDPARPREALKEGRLYYEWIAESYRIPTDVGTIYGPPVDEDYFLVDPPKPGQRLVISTNAADGQIAIALFAKSALTAPISDAPLSPMPGTAVTEQSGTADQPAESGGDAAAPLEDHTLVDQAVVRGSGSAEVEAASTDAAAGEQMLLRVTSGNGQSSASLYSLRARYIDEPAEQVCAPTSRVNPDVEVVAASDLLTSTTNTLYLFDSQRMAETYGVEEAARVRAALGTLDGTGHVGAGAGTIDGAVLSIDAYSTVHDARVELDKNPCSMSARKTLTGAINAAVATAVELAGAKISSIVLVGGDDIIPLAPVAQHTGQFNEDSHASDLRLKTLPGGSPCRPASETEGIDLCATPLSAAAATNYILTDDPYGLADAFESAGGFLYVPTVGLGRLIETPDQIVSTIDRFKAAEGVLAADTTLTRGYGAWSELPDVVTGNLSWRSTSDDDGLTRWDKDFLESALFPVVADGTDTDVPVPAGSARVISINAHADETRMLPDVDGAEAGRFGDSDLFTAEGRTGAPQLEGALVFQIGCHEGGNLPTGYYGDVADWPDVFSSAGGFIGNTGYGLANNVSTALGERLLGLYSEWVGRQSGGAPISASGALTYAKQAYLGGLGLYSGYDEKVLMEAVYYGLPMYTFGGELHEAPLPEIPELTKQFGAAGVLTAASLTLDPQFTTANVSDDRDREVSYLIADGQDPLVIPGQPILPRVVSQLGAAPEGRAARGALITSLSSRQSGTLTPAVAEPSVGIPAPGTDRSNVAFPSTFATVTSQLTPSGPTDLLVVTPGRVESNGGVGRLEQFTEMGVTVNYGSTETITQADGTVLVPDTTAPVFRSVDVPAQGQNRFRAVVDATGDGTTTGDTIVRVLLLTEDQAEVGGERHWSSTDLTAGLQDFDGDGVQEVVWAGQTPPGRARWILQAVDAAGNVAIETARGHLAIVGASSPQLIDDGTEATVPVRERLLRAVTISDAGEEDNLTATVALSDAKGAIDSAGIATIKTGADGVTRAIVDRVVETPGSFTGTVKVCRGTACSSIQFPVTVEVANTAPAASVAIEYSGAKISPTSVLTAVATASDPDGDRTTLTYSWHRNGSPEAIGTARTLDLSGKAAPGDVFAVVVTPNDGTDDGHQARAEVLVVGEPAAPEITLTARAVGASTDYQEGEWSLSDVTVTYHCTSGVEVTECPEDDIVSVDTLPVGQLVDGTMTDALGRTATAGILVRLDKTAPVLHPTFSPTVITQGKPATAFPNATDAGSGVASESCAVPQTAVAGASTVRCTATDNVGHIASILVPYTVEPPRCRGIIDRAALVPLNADGSSVFLRTSGVPVNFTACDAKGNPISTKKFVKDVVLVGSTSLPGKPMVNELWYPPVPVFTYVKPLGVWAGNIPTAKLTPGKQYTYRVVLADGTSFLVKFGVR